MKDKTIHKAKPINSHKIRESRDIDMTAMILLLGLIILIIIILMHCNNNPGAVLGLTEVLTMVEI